jgi:hypothetical protein
MRELGLTATGLAKRFGMTQPAVSYAVSRGEQIAKGRSDQTICLEDFSGLFVCNTLQGGTTDEKAYHYRTRRRDHGRFRRPGNSQ